MIKTIIEESKFSHLNEWIKACRHLPTFAQDADHLFGFRVHKESQSALPAHLPLEDAIGAQEGIRKRRVKIQDLIRHTLIMCGAQVPHKEAPRGTVARNAALFSGVDELSLLNFLTQILLKRWRSRRQGESACFFSSIIPTQMHTRVKQLLI